MNGLGRIAVVVGLFTVAGFEAGILFERWAARSAANAAPEAPVFGPRNPFGPGPGGAFQFVDRLTAELDLTPDQVRGVEEALSQSRSELDALLGATRPAIQQQVDTMRSRIKAILTEEQRAAFDVLLESDMSRFRQRMGNRPMPGFPPPSGVNK